MAATTKRQLRLVSRNAGRTYAFRRRRQRGMEAREVAIFRPGGTEAVIGLAPTKSPTLLAWPARTGSVVLIARK